MIPSTITRFLIILGVLSVTATSAIAANVTDGLISIGTSDFAWNSDTVPNPKHDTDNHGTPNSELGDGSGGERYDINFLGMDIAGGEFQFGVAGGSILSTPHEGASIGTNPMWLGDIAINVTDTNPYQDPTDNSSTPNSSAWDYAIRILNVNDNPGKFNFEVYQANSTSSWEEVDIYGYETNPTASHSGHHSDTFRLNGGTLLADNGTTLFEGEYREGSISGSRNDHYVLEGSFDLGLLSLFDEQTGGWIITYLTMSCVNDEAIVEAHVSPVPLPSAVWLFGSALLGFIGMSRRTKV